MKKNYAKEFDKIASERAELARQDIELLHEVLVEIGGEYVWVNEDGEDREDNYPPYVICIAWDEPCDVRVNSVRLSETGGIIFNVTASDSGEDCNVNVDEIEDGHLEYVYLAMNLKED